MILPTLMTFKDHDQVPSNIPLFIHSMLECLIQRQVHEDLNQSCNFFLYLFDFVEIVKMRTGGCN